MQHPDGFGQAGHFILSSGLLPPLTLTLMDDGWTENGLRPGRRASKGHPILFTDPLFSRKVEPRLL